MIRSGAQDLLGCRSGYHKPDRILNLNKFVQVPFKLDFKSGFLFFSSINKSLVDCYRFSSVGVLFLQTSTMTSPTSQTPQDAIQHVISILQPNAVEITDFFTDYVVFDINAFLTLDEVDFKTSYSTSSSSTQRSLSPAVIKKLVNLQRWYASLISPDVSCWFSLTADDF